MFSDICNEVEMIISVAKTTIMYTNDCLGTALSNLNALQEHYLGQNVPAVIKEFQRAIMLIEDAQSCIDGATQELRESDWVQ